MSKTIKTPATPVVESNTSELSQEQFLKYTKGRQYIDAPEKRALKVKSANQWVNDSGQTVCIINFDAITPWHLAQVKEFIAAGQLQDASNCVLSGSVIVGSHYVPTKGETVNVQIIAGKTKAGEDALFVGAVTPVPVAASKTIDFSAMFE